MLSYGKVNASQELQAVIICIEMKWTYEEFLNQPAWFVDALRIKTNLDSDYQRREIKRSKRNG